MKKKKLKKCVQIFDMSEEEEGIGKKNTYKYFMEVKKMKFKNYLLLYLKQVKQNIMKNYVIIYFTEYIIYCS